MKRAKYIVGVDLAKGSSKTIIVVIPGRDVLDFSKDIEMIRQRIAAALKVPIELIDPKDIRLCDHPAFKSGATIRRGSAQ